MWPLQEGSPIGSALSLSSGSRSSLACTHNVLWLCRQTTRSFHYDLSLYSLASRFRHGVFSKRCTGSSLWKTWSCHLTAPGCRLWICKITQPGPSWPSADSAPWTAPPPIASWSRSTIGIHLGPRPRSERRSSEPALARWQSDGTISGHTTYTPPRTGHLSA